MTWRRVFPLVSLAAALVLSCTQPVPQEKATEILKELANRIANNPTSTDEQQGQWLLEICEKSQISKDSCLGILYKNPKGEEELKQNIVSILSLSDSAQHEATLEDIEKRKQTALSEIERQTEVDQNNLIQEYANKRLAKQKDLEEELARKQKDLEKLQAETQAKAEQLKTLQAPAPQP